MTTSRFEPSAAVRVASIRSVVRSDIPALKALIDATDLFPSDLLDEMMAAYFEKGASASEYWLTDDRDGPMAIAYYAPERMTEGTWNLYLIAVHPEHRNRGRGTALLRRVEADLAALGERLLLIETSGLPEFEATRAFYRANGYNEEARVRDFYKSGEDKVIYCKLV